AHVDLEATRANYRAIAEYLANEAELNRSAGKGPATPPGIIAVVKANAYGHGAVRMARALEEAGAAWLAVADIEEGIELREAGARARILIFGALSVSDLAGLFEYELTPTIASPAAGRALQRAALARNRRIKYHLKIDTGMHRLGFRHENLPWTLPELLASGNLDLEAVATHFATADEPEHSLFEQQRVNFESACAILGSLGARPQFRHAANSAATLRDSRVWYDFVRPGLLLYGVVPPPLHTTMPLAAVMSLTSRVVAVKCIRPGESVGYGGRFCADRPTTLAVIPAGYADGLDRRLEHGACVLIRGRRARIVGAVSMDMLTADVTDIGDVNPGDEVVFLGSQGAEVAQTLDAREMASAVSTIPYEILCRLGSRVQRMYR
ncbi:MAG TPA: alanine racemase, partial [Vicinamibacterales bacterium]|nr:alanine racemase [Vicinamibacterales bacterium]